MAMRVYAQLKGNDCDGVEHILEKIEKFWHIEEHPIYILSVVLHPRYFKRAVQMLQESLTSQGNWDDNRNVLTAKRLVQAVQFYYSKFGLYSSDSESDQANEKVRLQEQMLQWLGSKVATKLYVSEQDVRVGGTSR